VRADSVAFAFAAGMAAAINPCGFALLPAYLSYYLGLTDDAPADRRGSSVTSSLTRALLVSAAMTLGFVVVFGLIGSVWSTISSVLGERLPWITLGMGVLIVVLGIAMLAGFEPVVRIPHLDVGKGGQEFWSMFLFGVSYGLASLGCTIPIFMAVMTGTFAESAAGGISTFVAYALGMGALVALLTVAVALAREGLVRRLRGLLPVMGRISGGLLVVAGVLVVYAGFAEHEQLSGTNRGTGLFERLQDWQGNVSSWIERVGAGRIGLIVVVIIATALAISWLLHTRRQPTRES
jgi:cytochrome c biogenesis protein CcdA